MRKAAENEREEIQEVVWTRRDGSALTLSKRRAQLNRLPEQGVLEALRLQSQER